MPNQLPNIRIALGLRREAFWYPGLDLKQPPHLTSPPLTHVSVLTFLLIPSHTSQAPEPCPVLSM